MTIRTIAALGLILLGTLVIAISILGCSASGMPWSVSTRER